MKKNTIVTAAAIIAMAAVLPSCHRVRGEGPVVNRTFSAAAFSGVKSGIDGDVYFTQDSICKIEIEGQSNILDIIETPVVNGELNIQFRKFSNPGRHSRLIAHVSCPSPTSLGVNGSGNFFANSTVSSPNINLKVNGSGNITISSYTGNTLSGDISGSGRMAVNGGSVNSSGLHISGSMDMLGLYANYVTTSTSGSGDMTVNVGQRLDAQISGSGDVYYLGNPEIYTSISGSGKVMRY